MKNIGLTARQTFEALSGGISAGGRRERPPPLKKWEAVTRIVVSFLVLFLGIYLVVRPGPESQQKMGAGFIGLVTGYWFR